MATTKNITMKQFNGTDYDTLYPKTIAEQVDGIYGKDEILSNGTKALYGLTNSAVPDNVLALLSRFQKGLGNEYVWGKSDGTGIVGYVNSPDHNAYPPAVPDGYTYTPLGQMGAKVQIATGSYVGTGTYGESNPNSLTFGFVPEIVIITKNGARYGYGQQEPSAVSLLKGQTSFSAAYNGSATLNNTVSWGTTVSWYISGYVPGDVISVAPSLQLNNGETYYYIAIG